MGKPDITVEIAGIKLKNPVIAASGTFGYGTEYSGISGIESFGAIVAKGLTLLPQEGNPPPRIVETACGMINSIGLHNVGVEIFVREKLPELKKFNVPVIANVGGRPPDMAKAAAILSGSGVSAVELNLSCPNLKGAIISRSASKARKAVAESKKASSVPIIAKLTPQVSDIGKIAIACEEGGADAISLINTFPATAVDIEAKRAFLGNVYGGLSGPAIKPIALKLVWEACRAVKIPVIGMGGIMNSEDALEFILAGARAVAVGTAIFAEPRVAELITRGIEEYLSRHGHDSVSEITGVINAE